MLASRGASVAGEPGRAAGDPAPDVDLVIFDCDGVLVDSERLSVDISVQVMNEYGLNLTRAQVIERFVGGTDGLIEATIERETGRELTPDERAAIRSRYHDTFEQRLAPVSGVEKMLEKMRWRTCVASGSRPDALRRKLEVCGLLEHFDGRLFSASQVDAGKPAPDLFLFAASVMGAGHARCVVVEDSVFGVRAARAAGMRVLAYTGGLIAAEALAGFETVLFDDMEQVPSLISEMGSLSR